MSLDFLDIIRNIPCLGGGKKVIATYNRRGEEFTQIEDCGRYYSYKGKKFSTPKDVEDYIDKQLEGKQ